MDYGMDGWMDELLIIIIIKNKKKKNGFFGWIRP